MRRLLACRTAALGGHVESCDRCDYERIAFNSCRDRHCPKCQANARALWVEAREDDLLPVTYFHVVFTVPPEIAAIALQNKRVMYGILMRASADTLLQIAADPKHLGAEIGFLSVLHTWGQTLIHHPHVHCVVPGGGLSKDGRTWIGCRPGFFLPLEILSSVFRGKFLDMTRRAFARDELVFQGGLAQLADAECFKRHLAGTYAHNWVVYVKTPFGGVKHALRYLARYTHRVAIANSRITAIADGKVSFRYKDYARGSRQRTMTLDAIEFLRRFLQHVLPKGFVRIRSYGLLANAVRTTKLAACRAALGVVDIDASQTPTTPDEPPPSDSPPRCPACSSGFSSQDHNSHPLTDGSFSLHQSRSASTAREPRITTNKITRSLAQLWTHDITAIRGPRSVLGRPSTPSPLDDDYADISRRPINPAPRTRTCQPGPPHILDPASTPQRHTTPTPITAASFN